MIKLFFKNKFVELVNIGYHIFHTLYEERQLLFVLLCIFLALLAQPLLGHEVIMLIDAPPRLTLSEIYGDEHITILLAVVGCITMVCTVVVGLVLLGVGYWIKSNVRLAKDGTKVDYAWNKKESEEFLSDYQI